MATKSTLTDPLHSDLKIIKELAYDTCRFELTNFKRNAESEEYRACSFMLSGKTIEYRVSKITPTKSGQFVTIWKRNKNGITQPFDVSDKLDFVIITSKNESNFGQFIFPKSVLADKAIVTTKGKEGKRGIRVYPPWDTPTSKQAQKTQQWQTKYFLTIRKKSTDLELLKKLLA